MGGERVADGTGNETKYSSIEHLPFLLVSCANHSSVKKSPVNELKHRVHLKRGLNPSFPDGIVGLSFEDRDSLHDGGVNLEFGGCGESCHFLWEVRGDLKKGREQ